MKRNFDSLVKSLITDGGYKLTEIYEADLFYLLEVMAEEKGINEDDGEEKSLFEAFGK